MKQLVGVEEALKATNLLSEKHLLIRQTLWITADFDLNRVTLFVDERERVSKATVKSELIANVEPAGDYKVLKKESG